MAAIEGRWNDEKPAGEVLFAWPDVEHRRNLFAITLPPPFGSLIDSDSLSAGETGLNSIPPENWPPVVIPFFSFRIMVGCGMVMLGLAWLGSYLSFRHRLERNRPLLWLTFLSFPLPFIAILTGWFTAEVGRQPWVVYGVLRTADAMTPFLTTRDATISLVIFCAVYAFIFAFGTFYIYRLIRTGPGGKLFETPHAAAVPNRPMSLANTGSIHEHSHVGAGE
jgi:cytochrome d ubiquinol oxidase subunit I